MHVAMRAPELESLYNSSNNNIGIDCYNKVVTIILMIVTVQIVIFKPVIIFAAPGARLPDSFSSAQYSLGELGGGADDQGSFDLQLHVGSGQA